MRDSGSERPDAPRLTMEEWHKAYPLAGFICRAAIEAMSIHELDYVDLVLYMLVATACIDTLFGQLSWTDGLPEIADGAAEGLEALSISRVSLAQDTRLPRETVRRRVASLVEKGWIEEDRNGFLTVPPGRFFNESNERLFRALFDEYEALEKAFARVEEAASKSR